MCAISNDVYENALKNIACGDNNKKDLSIVRKVLNDKEGEIRIMRAEMEKERRKYVRARDKAEKKVKEKDKEIKTIRKIIKNGGSI